MLLIIYIYFRNNLYSTVDLTLMLFYFSSARLVGGKSPQEGLVQVYHNNNWIWVCADQWDKHDADVACKMMGFLGSLSVFYDREKTFRRNRQYGSIACSVLETKILSFYVSMAVWERMAARLKPVLYVSQKVRLNQKSTGH